LFVCSGNICRSPLAHKVFEQVLERKGILKNFELESAGTHGYHTGDNADPRMRATAARRGFPFSHLARVIQTGDLKYYDLILVMDQGHKRQIMNLAKTPEEIKKIRLYREFDPEGGPDAEVPDPYYGSQEDFDLVFDIVLRTSENLLEALDTQNPDA